MKVGDLVKWETNAWVFDNAKKGYKNPGIILEVGGEQRQIRYMVLWADGNITTEHPGFLRGYNDAST